MKICISVFGPHTFTVQRSTLWDNESPEPNIDVPSMLDEISVLRVKLTAAVTLIQQFRGSRDGARWARPIDAFLGSL